jgi:hypothetical protein
MINNSNPGGIFGTGEQTGIGGYLNPNPQLDTDTKIMMNVLGRPIVYDPAFARTLSIRDNTSRLFTEASGLYTEIMKIKNLNVPIPRADLERLSVMYMNLYQGYLDGLINGTINTTDTRMSGYIKSISKRLYEILLQYDNSPTGGTQ